VVVSFGEGVDRVLDRAADQLGGGGVVAGESGLIVEGAGQEKDDAGRWQTFCLAGTQTSSPAAFTWLNPRSVLPPRTMHARDQRQTTGMPARYPRNPAVYLKVVQAGPNLSTPSDAIGWPCLTGGAGALMIS
jgi:hypothetical protein